MQCRHVEQKPARQRYFIHELKWKDALEHASQRSEMKLLEAQTVRQRFLFGRYRSGTRFHLNERRAVGLAVRAIHTPGTELSVSVKLWNTLEEIYPVVLADYRFVPISLCRLTRTCPAKNQPCSLFQMSANYWNRN
ncbi:Hypothetical_protein [Hexamita inflata]|uniref:Hypothetical_protein n=1 Tax=Hexamita inflata TaxID=28002 RepID=A0AA86Q6X9_9EUKA|nr:Hypothetical protein HINF_LOCUS40033 [Hexamita inflata]